MSISYGMKCEKKSIFRTKQFNVHDFKVILFVTNEQRICHTFHT